MRWSSKPMLPGKRVPKILMMLLVCSFVAAGLSGCLGEPEPDPEIQDEEQSRSSYDEDGRDLRRELTQEDELPAPQWEIGDWFGLHLYLADEGGDGTHFDAIVVEDQGDAWLLATDHLEIANMQAMWDIPVLGEIKKADLSSTGFDTTWDWMYDFPLAHEKSWTRQMEFADFETGQMETLDIEFTAQYASAIETMDGARPGFQIQGVTPDGERIAEYDFVPDVGWFAHFYLYEPGHDDWMVHVMSMGRGTDWTGTYYLNEADVVVEHFNAVFPGPPLLEGEPYASFDVDPDADLLSGILVIGAFTGTQQVVLAPPEGEPYHYSVDPTPDFGFQQIWLEEEAVEGTWQLASPGVGMVAFHYIMLFQIQVNPHDLPAA